MSDLWGPEARARARAENAQLKGGNRQCVACLAWKPLVEFHKHRRGWLGYRRECIDCFKFWRKRSSGGKKAATIEAELQGGGTSP